MNYLHAFLIYLYNNVALRLVFLAFMAFPSARAAAPLQLVTAALPPFSFEQDGAPRGIAVDLVKEAFGRLQVPIRITFLPMTRAQTMMAAGTADGVFPLAYKEERLNYVSYPREKLVEDSISFFVRQDSDIRYDGDIAKLAQYSFGVERGAVYGPNFTQALLNGQIKRTDEAATQAQNVAKLVGRRFDIAVGPRLVMQYSAEVSGHGNAVKELKPSVDLGLVAFLGFSRLKDHSALIARYDKVMQEMRKDGTYDRILRNYTRR